VKTILCGLLLASSAHAQSVYSTDVPYPTQWSQPRVLPDGTVVPAVPTKFQTRQVGVQFAPVVAATPVVPPAVGASGGTPLMIAADKGDTNTVNALLANGANVNGANVTGRNALMAAADGGRLEVVKLLLEKSAEINEVTREGKTALIFAAQKGQFKVVQALLEAGADKKVLDQSGKMAIDYALAGNFNDVVAILNGEPVKKSESLKKVDPPKKK